MRNIKTQTNIKVFFNTSSRAEESVKKSSLDIFNFITNFGLYHTHDFRKDEKEYSSNSSEDKLEILYADVIKSLHQSDIVILEISTNSFTQGYILQKALEMGKPIIALHQRGKYSIFVKGIKNPLLQTVEYDNHQLRQLLDDALNFAIDNLMIKFNFYLPNDIGNYLTWISKRKNLPKSEIVRALLRSHMGNNEEYLSSLS